MESPRYLLLGFYRREGKNTPRPRPFEGVRCRKERASGSYDIINQDYVLSFKIGVRPHPEGISNIFLAGREI
jgi:hypothetical protein